MKIYRADLDFTLYVVLGVVAAILITPIIYILLTGDFPGSYWFYGLQEDCKLVEFLLGVR